MFIGQFAVVRTYSAGVHCGIIKEMAVMGSNTAVVLEDSRRIWWWSQAFTLNEVSQDGIGEDSRISNPVPLILLTQAIEVIPCSEKAQRNLSRSRNGVGNGTGDG